ncbi:GNAT family N-acetyltransferase [Chitinophaga arvensicola]|uniref:Protein N-acetyltransferase, RimJ/RimL family n=1 Tax=Chitinophaga arvensicola TaxID=29529 RepID=A0A1I0NLQ0_9BACT|nr:GNAT family protein [Chitinophaga arvensicola]SEW02370.1 Protein N-acetyltransferase, RimJ/RimL family [Chitinophaga arvensicola]
MELSSDKLCLIPATAKDIPAIHRLHSLPETDRFNTLGLPADIGVTTSIVNGWLKEEGQQVWCITLKDTREFIGLAGMVFKPVRFNSAEIWYKLDVAHWGNGYATELVGELLSYAFDTLRLHRMEAGCAVENTASARVLEKCGFQLEGRKREVLPIRGAWVDNFMYGILSGDYQQAKSR